MKFRKRPLLHLFSLVILAATLAMSPKGLSAQGAHYWSEQFGNRSMILGGAVVGSVTDLGAVFYNPGRLDLIENPSFVLSGKAYQWDRHRITDGLGPGRDLKRSSFGGAPSLVAGSFTLPFLKDHQFAYAFLTRHSSNVDFSIRSEVEGNVIGDFPGNEFFVGNFRRGSVLKEEWIGVSWARSFWEGVSVGLSTFATSESRKQDYQVGLGVLGAEGNVAALRSYRDYRYSSYGLLWKGGLALERGRFQLGVTATTPKVTVTGNGRIKYEELVSGMDPIDPENPSDRFETNSQSNLPAETRSPWAVALGAGLKAGDFTLHLSSEWYGSVPEYRILTSDPFIGQSTGDTIRSKVIDEAESVLNLGFGIEYRAGPSFSAYGSIATDHSAAPENAFGLVGFEESVSDETFGGDFVRVGGGIVLTAHWADITLGATFAESRQDYESRFQFPSEDDPGVVPIESTARYLYSKWRFLFALSIPFAEDVLGRVGGEGGTHPNPGPGR